MSVQFLLDGYNIVHKIRELSQKSLEDQRRSLISLLEIRRPQGSVKNTVTIIFDGKPGVIGVPETSWVKVIFTRNESADDRIKEIIRQASDKKNYIVVSDDRDIQYAVRALGAKVMSVEDFLIKGKVSGNAHRATPGTPLVKEAGKNISRALEFKITSELEKIWLRDKK